MYKQFPLSFESMYDNVRSTVYFSYTGFWLLAHLIQYSVENKLYAVDLWMICPVSTFATIFPKPGSLPTLQPTQKVQFSLN